MPAFMSSRPTLLVLAFLLAPLLHAEGGDRETSPTLTLDALLRPADAGRSPVLADWTGGYDPEGPPFALPARELFAAPPSQEPASSTASLLPDDLELPDLPPRGFSDSDIERKATRPLLEEKGRDTTVPRDKARVEIVHGGEEMFFTWKLERAGEADAELVLLLAPGASDQFLVPAGEYAARRVALLDPENGIERIDQYPAQTLQGGWRYEVIVTPDGERVIREQERWKLRRTPIRQRIDLR
ncbi:MAG: hypothetical protein PWP23_93 [Candidatus Sumerlaeota bacterium]|nr:hypothetical protein [Candidatus Sumerlaeota bacterium]